MKISKLFYSLFLGLSIYSLLVFSDGDTGLKAMTKVELYRDQLNSNLDTIRKINNDLTINFDSLSSDSEMIKLKARALGYFDKDDHLVHVTNWNPDYNEYKPGHIIKKEYLSDVNESRFRLISFSSIIISLIVLLMFETVKRHTNINR